MKKQVKLWMPMLLLAMIFLATACQKGEDFINPPSDEELLADAPWVYTAHTIDPANIQGGLVISDLYAQRDACDQDDVYTFSSTGTFNLEQGEETCTANAAQVIDSGTWTISEDSLTLDFLNSDDEVYEISELDRDELVLLKKYKDSAGVNITETLTFEHLD